MQNPAPKQSMKHTKCGEDNALHALAANRLSSELAQNEKKYNVEATNNIYLAGGTVQKRSGF